MTKSEADKIAKEIAEHSGIAYETVRNLVKDKISAALVDASKVTECADFDEWWCQQCYKETFLITNGKHEIFAKECFLAGQKSNALKLPEKAIIDSSVMDEESIIFARHQNYWIDQIKSLNEGK